MQHYKQVNEICTTMQKQITDEEVKVLPMSAVQKYLKGSSERDSSAKAANDDSETFLTPSKKKDRSMSLRTSMEWGDGGNIISAASSVAKNDLFDEQD
jgi:hypothetical protein